MTQSKLNHFLLLASFIILPLPVVSYMTPGICQQNLLQANEFLVDTHIVYIPSVSDISYPKISYDGLNYLVVWNANRFGEYRQDIFGARVSRSGDLLDSAAIPLCLMPGSQNTPSIAFDGINHLAVWSDFRTADSCKVFGVRIDTSGEVLDSAEILIAATSSRWPADPTVAHGGDKSLIVWVDKFTDDIGVIKAKRINHEGHIIDTSAIVVAQWARTPPFVSFDGNYFFVVFSLGSTLYACRIDTSGAIIDTIDIETYETPHLQPSCAFDGKRQFVVWEDWRNIPDIYGARVDTSGIVIDSVSLPLITGSYFETLPRIAYNGSLFFLVWEDYRDGSPDVYGSRIDTSGMVLDTAGIQIAVGSIYQGFPWLISDSTVFFSVWYENRKAVYGARIDTAGTILDSASIVISSEAYRQWFPSVAFNGKNYLSVWQDMRNGENFDIYAARIDTSGTILDETSIPISTESFNQTYPDIAYGISNHLVVWQDERFYNIRGVRIDTMGVLLDTNAIFISDTMGFQVTPAIAFDGRHYFTVWIKGDGQAGIFGVRVDTSGNVIDSAYIFISNNQNFAERYPAIASNGNNYLVAWYELGIHGNIVDTSGFVHDTISFEITPHAIWGGYPSVASNGIDYFVVWQDGRNPRLDIYGARVSSSGIVIDTNGIPLAVAPEKQQKPSVVFDGLDYIVLWEDYSNLYAITKGARVDTSGIVTDTFTVPSQCINHFWAQAAPGPGDQLLVTYAGFVDSINGRPANTMRIFGNLFTPPIGVEHKENSSQPKHFFLSNPIPNPTAHAVDISYEISHEPGSRILLTVYDISGRKIRTLIDGFLRSGHHTVRWDLRNNMERKIAAGIYFCKLQIDKESQVKKLIILN